jgi:hypothetical protein
VAFGFGRADTERGLLDGEPFRLRRDDGLRIFMAASVDRRTPTAARSRAFIAVGKAFRRFSRSESDTDRP